MNLIDESAVLAPDLQIGKGIKIGAFTVIGANCIIRDNVTIGSNCVIEEGCVIGEGCRISTGVAILHGSTIGVGTYLAPKIVVGSEGYGYTTDSLGVHHYIPQIGTVYLAGQNQIESHVCIDRAAFRRTQLGSRSVVEAWSHVAHNVKIGSDAHLKYHSVIGGSSTLGDKVICGQWTTVTGHIQVGTGVVLGQGSGVTKSTSGPAQYEGFPLMSPEVRSEGVEVLRELTKLIEVLDQIITE